MTEDNNQNSGNMCRCGMCGSHGKGKFATGFWMLSITGSLLLIALFAVTLKEYHYVGRDIMAQTTIVVNGEGEMYQKPDMATVSFGIMGEAKTPTEAGNSVETRMKKIEEFLASAGVGKEDIKTIDYGLYPKYEYIRSMSTCPEVKLPTGMSYPPCVPDAKQVLSGYQVSQTVEVKIRSLDNAGKVVGGLTDNGATNISGLSFMVENDEKIRAQARDEAIKDAQVKAEELARQLGVKLVRIVSFNEGSNYPMYNYARGGMMDKMSVEAPSVPSIPVGQNKYMSNVSVVYEIQ